MSENTNEVLNIAIETTENGKDASYLNDEKTLKTIADIVLLVGIISAVILFASIGIVSQPGRYSWEDEETVASGSGIVITLGVLFSSIATWAFFRVMSNISISLKELNRKNAEK